MAIAYKSIGLCFFVFVFPTGVKVPFAAAFRFLVAPARGHPAKTSHRQVVALWSWLVYLVLTNPAFRFLGDSCPLALGYGSHPQRTVWICLRVYRWRAILTASLHAPRVCGMCYCVDARNACAKAGGELKCLGSHHSPLIPSRPGLTLNLEVWRGARLVACKPGEFSCLCPPQH